MNTWQRSWTKAVLGDFHNKTHREDGGIRKAKPQAWMIRKSWRSSDAFLNLLCLEITKDLLLSCESQYCSGFSWKLHHISADFSAFSLKAKNCKSTINILLSLTKLLASEKNTYPCFIRPNLDHPSVVWGSLKAHGWNKKKPFHLLNYSTGICLRVCCQPRSVWRGQHLKLFGTGLVQALPNKQVTSVLCIVTGIFPHKAREACIDLELFPPLLFIIFPLFSCLSIPF